MTHKTFILFFVFFSHPVFGYILQKDINACGTYSKLYAVFQPLTYTCQPGYFLPANSENCRSCPDGYTCAGGTFNFNPTISQGAIRNGYFTQKASNICASNLSHKMVAIFTPNTLNLTWNDDNGNTTTSTCTYDGLINLPEPPTRPGYVFSGWRVDTSN